MIEMGLVVCLGLTMWFMKCKWKTRMWILSHSLFIDIMVFIFLTIIHWGTYSGVMVATVGALMASLLLTIGRKVFGCMRNGDYVRGMVDISDRLSA